MAGVFDIFKTTSVSPANATAGPAASFTDAFAAAFEDQSKNWSTLGAQAQVIEEATRIAKEYGLPDDVLRYPDWADRGDELFDHVLNGKPLENEGWKAFAEALDTVRQQDPTAPTLNDIVTNTRAQAAGIETRAQIAQDRTRDFGAWVGGFAGSMAGSFTNKDPFNIASVVVGGFGRNVIQRIATEAGLNAGVEAINQFTGVADTRAKLDLDLTLQDQLANVAFAGIGAGVLRAGGEAIGKGWNAGKAYLSRDTNVRAAAIVADEEAAIARANPFGPAANDDIPLSRYETAAHEAIVNRAVTQPVGADQTIFDTFAYTGREADIDRVVQEIAPDLLRARQAVEDEIAKLEAIEGELKTVTSKNGAIYRDTRAMGEQFHGSSSRIEAFDEGHYNSSNIYGNGFYTTDAVDIAAGYRRKGKGDSPVMYRVKEKFPAQLFDMESPIEGMPDALRKQLTEEDSMFSQAYESYKFDNPDKEPNLRELMDELRGISRNEGWSRDDVHEAFDALEWSLRDLGYDGMSHRGGLLTENPEHKVKIYFEPHNTIDLEEVDLGAFQPKLHNKRAELDRIETRIREAAVSSIRRRPTEDLTPPAADDAVAQLDEAFLEEPDQLRAAFDNAVRQSADETTEAISLPTAEVPLDMPIILEPGGKPITVRRALVDAGHDDDLINAMRSCLL